MAVNADASSPEYGRMRILHDVRHLPDRRPGQAFNAMNANETVADRLRPFLNQGAATATFGNLLTLPLGGGLLYVTPVYTQRQGSTGSYPALRFVVVRFGQEVGIGDTLQQALDQVFEGDSGVPTRGGRRRLRRHRRPAGAGQPGRDQGAGRGRRPRSPPPTRRSPQGTWRPTRPRSRRLRPPSSGP